MLNVTSANSTDTGSYETTTDLLNDRVNLIAATTLIGFTYGIMTTLYCMTTHSLLKKFLRRTPRSGSNLNSFSRSRAEGRKTLFYLVYTFILFVLATLFTASNSQNAIVVYVENRLYPEGPYQYYIKFMAGQKIMIMTDVTFLIILWMTDALILCRFIVFYYKVPYARWVIPLPCAMYVGVIVLSTLVFRGEAASGKIYFFSENMLLAYYALSFSLNVLTTVLIAARLYWHKIQLERVFGPRTESPYMSLATMLIESAALYGAWSLVFLVLCMQPNPGQTIILATISQIQVIATLLIILGIARGQAWNRGKSYGEDEEDDTLEHSHRPHPSAGGVMRPSAGSRPLHVVMDEFGMDGDAGPNAGRNASWSTVVGSSEANHRGGGADLDVNALELGLCGSELSSDLKA